jgi:hypothetical protein
MDFSHEDIMLNRKLLHEMITKHPEQHNQAIVYHNTDSDMRWNRHATVGEYAQSCGTTACVVGWTLLLAFPFDMPVREVIPDEMSDYEVAATALGVDMSEMLNVYGMEKEQAVAWVKELSTRG